MTEFVPEKAPHQSKRKHLIGVSKIRVGRNSPVRAARPWSDPLEAGDPQWAERKRSWKAALQPYVDRFAARGDRNDRNGRGENW